MKYFKKTILYFKVYGFKYTMSKITKKIGRFFRVFYWQWILINRLKGKERKRQKGLGFDYRPKFTIISVGTSKERSDLIESLSKQTYSNWEVLSINDLEHAKGDFIGFFTCGDRLLPNALFEFANRINQVRDVDVIYADNDELKGRIRRKPNFKPDYSVDYLRSTNYILNPVMYSKDICEELGSPKTGFYDYILRACENAEKIEHIPKLLCSIDKDSYGMWDENAKEAIAAHLDRVGTSGRVFAASNLPGCYRIKYDIKKEKMVSIIIPNKDHVDDLDVCIKSIIEKQTYKNYEILVVENNSEKEDTFKYYEKIEKKYSCVRVLYWDKEFNYSAINNFAVKQANGEYILLLNNDTKMQRESCLKELVSYGMRPEVGIVGARLLYGDNTIQHAGVIIGYGGLADHAFSGMRETVPGYQNRIKVASNLSAVTAACLLVRKNVYEEVGGMEEKLSIAFNDVDFCLKVRKAGYLVVYNPYAKLYHYESKSRGIEDTPEKIQRFEGEVSFMKEKWKEILEKGDPYYNVNLTFDRKDFSLK